MAQPVPFPGRMAIIAFAWVALAAGLIGTVLSAFMDPSEISVGLFRSYAHNAIPLFIFGYSAGFITLARAVIHDDWWSWAAPTSQCVGTFFLLLGAPKVVPTAFYLLAFALLSMIYFSIFVQQGRLSQIVQATGATSGFCAVALWALQMQFSEILPLIIVFVFATAVGERAGSGRIVFANKKIENLFVVVFLGMFGLALIAVPLPEVGSPLFGVYLFLAVGVMSTFDLCWREISNVGLVRLRSLAMIASYSWSAIVGVIMLTFGYSSSGPVFDVVFSGFFFGSVISHVISGSSEFVAAVFDKMMHYRPFLAIPLIGMHAGLLVQLIGGDARGIEELWQLGVVATCAFCASWFVLALSCSGKPLSVAANIREFATVSVAPGEGSAHNG